MEEPVGQKIRMDKEHWQARTVYAAYGIALITMLLIIFWCYHIFSRNNTPESMHDGTEVYILKDEVVETGYMHSNNSNN